MRSRAAYGDMMMLCHAFDAADARRRVVMLMPACRHCCFAALMMMLRYVIVLAICHTPTSRQFMRYMPLL